MSMLEQIPFGPQPEKRQLTTRETAELMKRAAERLLQISVRLGDKTLVNENVEWFLNTSVQEMTTAIYYARKEPSKNLVDGPEYDWSEFDVSSTVND